MIGITLNVRAVKAVRENSFWWMCGLLFWFLPAMPMKAEVPASALNEFAEVTVDYLRDGDIPAARSGYTQLHQKFPDYAEPVFNLGALAEDQGDIPSAIKWYRSFLELAPDHPKAAEAVGRIAGLADATTVAENYEIGLARAWARLDEGDAAGAYAEASALAAIDPTRFEAPAMAARALIADRAWPEALSFLEEAASLAPSGISSELKALRREIVARIELEQAWDEAEESEAKGAWIEAANLYATLAANDAKGRAALFAGMNFAVGESWDQAESWLERASQSESADIAEEARARLRAVKTRRAIESAAPGEMPGSLSYATGVQLLAQGNATEALKALDEAIKQTPVNPEFSRYFLLRGTARLEVGEAQLAIEDFDRALLIDASQTRVHRLRALANSELNRPNDAINDYRLAIAAAGDNSADEVMRMRVHIVELYQSAGLRRTAIEEAKKLTNLEPGSDLSNRTLRARKNSARYLSDDKEEIAALALLLRSGQLRSDERSRLDSLRRSWVVTMTKQGHGQGWSWSDGEFEKKAQSLWLEKKDVNDLTYRSFDRQWFLLTRTPREYAEQDVNHSSVFPQDWIQLKWDQQYDITNVVYAADEWHVMMARGADFGGQRWSTVSSINGLRDKISEAWAESYRIQDIAYGNGRWGVVFSTRPPFSGKQRWISSIEFPADWISEGYDTGYIIVQVVHGDGKWLVVMGESNLGQRYIRRQDFPNEKIEQYWGEGYRVTDIVHVEEPLP